VKRGRQHLIRKGTVMTGTAATALVPGISAAEQHYLDLGAREFFERQGADVLTEFVRRRAGGHRAPATLTFADDLPKTATGKVQRFRLRPT